MVVEYDATKVSTWDAALAAAPPPPRGRAPLGFGAELLVPVAPELAEDGAAEEDAETGGLISPDLGCAISTGLRSTGADDEEIAAINIACTSIRETTGEIIGWIAICDGAAATLGGAAAGVIPELEQRTILVFLVNSIRAGSIPSAEDPRPRIAAPKVRRRITVCNPPFS